jgi:hypothetical protein
VLWADVAAAIAAFLTLAGCDEPRFFESCVFNGEISGTAPSRKLPTNMLLLQLNRPM